MFTWLNRQGVRSDQGFSVQRTGRFTCEYREGERVLELEVESGLIGGKPCINVKRGAFAKWRGEGDGIPPEQQIRILENFTAAMAFQGLAVVID
jgi:hypothetical protein